MPFVFSIVIEQLLSGRWVQQEVQRRPGPMSNTAASLVVDGIPPDSPASQPSRWVMQNCSQPPTSSLTHPRVHLTIPAMDFLFQTGAAADCDTFNF